MGLGVGKAPLQVRTAGGSFYVGPHAHDWGRPVKNMDHNRSAGSPELRALLCGALTHYAALAEDRTTLLSDLELTVGLPLESLTGDDEAVKTTVAAVRRWLEGEHTWEADGTTSLANVVDVAVTSQPVGALFDFLLDEHGAFLPAQGPFRSEVGVLSVGMNTVELLAVRGGQVAPGDTYAERRGVRRFSSSAIPTGCTRLASWTRSSALAGWTSSRAAGMGRRGGRLDRAPLGCQAPPLCDSHPRRRWCQAAAQAAARAFRGQGVAAE